MKSISETGHAKNVANFGSLISYCIAYDSVYNPANPLLAIDSLNTIHTNSKNSLTHVNTAFSSYSVAVDERDAAFEPINKLATRIINSLDASAVPRQAIDDARTIIRKIQGKRASTIPAKSAAPESQPADSRKTISVSQLSYDNRIGNFEKLIQQLASQSGYNPNETELKISSLNTLSSELKNKNSAVVNASVTLSNARISRNNILYTKPDSLVPVSAEVKKYVKSIFGTSSPQYKQISSLKFVLIK